jgi:ribose transport system permease protein
VSTDVLGDGLPGQQATHRRSASGETARPALVTAAAILGLVTVASVGWQGVFALSVGRIAAGFGVFDRVVPIVAMLAVGLAFLILVGTFQLLRGRGRDLFVTGVALVVALAVINGALAIASGNSLHILYALVVTLPWPAAALVLSLRPATAAWLQSTGGSITSPPLLAKNVVGLPHAGLCAVIVALFIFATARSEYFFTAFNMGKLIEQLSIGAVIAAGLTMLMVAGGMDFSMGSILAVCAGLCAKLLVQGHGEPWAIAVALLAGIGFGLVNGLIVTLTRVAPFVVTLATAMILDGLFLVVINDKTQDTEIGWLDNHLFTVGEFALPNLFVIALIVMVVVGLIMRYTTFGRDAYAIGGNEDVARLSGISVTRNKLLLYSLAGLLAAIAGVMWVARFQGTSTSGVGGLTTQLSAVAAVVIGGTSLAGGRGTIVGTALGVVLIQLVDNVLTFMHVGDWKYHLITVGTVLLVAAVVNLRHQRSH